MDLIQLLTDGVKEYGISLDDRQISQMFKYKDLLLEWNEKINLTAIEEDRDVIIKHYIDSLSICPLIDNPESWLIDIGTGAGFPGIPVKVAFKSTNVVLLDSLDKRVRFLKEVIQNLDLNGIEALHGRAEDYGICKEHREKYDIAVARAVGALPVLLEYCLPFVKTNGIFIAMKGSSIEEIDQSKKALEILGGEIVDIKETILPFSDIKRNIIVVKKLRQTPTKYPRKAGKPSKEPLV